MQGCLKGVIQTKKVISACIDQVIQFDSELEVDRYKDDLKHKKQIFKIMWKNTLDNGKVLIRIRRQYNNHFMEEGDED